MPGAPGLLTVTENSCVTVPALFVATTITVVVPADTGVTLTTDPDTVTDATPEFVETAVNCRYSPEKAPATSTSCGGCPTSSSRSARLPTACGASGFRTVTSNVCIAVPALFVAVTVTVVVPTDTGVTVTTDPDTVSNAWPGFDETAVKTSASPVKTFATSTSCGGCPSTSVMSSRLPTACGAFGFRTFTSNVCIAWPRSFRAVTVTVVMPTDNGLTLTTDPDVVTTATPEVDDAAE